MPPKSALGKAMHYLKEQWPYLVRYLEDGRLEVSNNRAKRIIKPFVMGPEELAVCQYPGGSPGQRGDLQPDGNRAGPLQIPSLGAAGGPQAF